MNVEETLNPFLWHCGPVCDHFSRNKNISVILFLEGGGGQWTWALEPGHVVWKTPPPPPFASTVCNSCQNTYQWPKLHPQSNSTLGYFRNCVKDSKIHDCWIVFWRRFQNPDYRERKNTFLIPVVEHGHIQRRQGRGRVFRNLFVCSGESHWDLKKKNVFFKGPLGKRWE